MTLLTIRSFGLAGPVEGFPAHKVWSGHPGVRSILGDAQIVGEALRAHYLPLKLRRLDPYVKTALLASRLAMETFNKVPADLGLVVCTGYGPIPATNVFMDSYMDFGSQGASPTAFSQTVHNVAASTISMLLGVLGPTLAVSQPGLGLSSALLTAKSWMDQGLADAILFGAVDDCHSFRRMLFPGCSLKRAGHDPVAAFAVLTNTDNGSNLLEVRDVRVSNSSTTKISVDVCVPGPVDILSGFLTALDAERRKEEILVEESWAGFSTSIHIRSAHRLDSP